MRSSWSVIMVLFSLVLSTMSKHSILPYGVTYWRLCGKCTWERLKLPGNYFLWESGRKERQSESSCLETQLRPENSVFSMSDLPSSCMMMLLQQSNVLSERPYYAVRVHFDDDMTHQFFKALVPQLHLSKNVYCFPEGEWKKKRQKIFQKTI